MNLLLLLLALWMGYLAAEALRLRRWQKAVPLRITVTGTRGKTSTARMLASILRAHGRRVVAKTTGSQARIILPDGTERPVRRRGVPSILEQIGLLRTAVKQRAQVVVAEIMSVHEENHRVESQRILRPHLVLVTNFRVDHTEAAGWTREEVAALHLADIPPGATVLVPEEELVPGFSEAVAKIGSTLVSVATAEQEPPEPTGSSSNSPLPFGAENLALVRGAARELGVPEGAMIRGLREARGDLGVHWVRRYQQGKADPGASPPSSSPDALVEMETGTSSQLRTALTVNAFSANDPSSTELILNWALNKTSTRGWTGASRGSESGWTQDSDGNEASGSTGQEAPHRKVIGLLNLRADRGDRTVQWLRAMTTGFRERFHRLYVMGFHAPAFRRGLARAGLGEGVSVLKEDDPGKAMAAILARGPGSEPLIFGFGNFVGMGEAMVVHWLDRGEELGPADGPGGGVVDSGEKNADPEPEGSGRIRNPNGPEPRGDDIHGA